MNTLISESLTPHLAHHPLQTWSRAPRAGAGHAERFVRVKTWHRAPAEGIRRTQKRLECRKFRGINNFALVVMVVEAVNCKVCD